MENLNRAYSRTEKQRFRKHTLLVELTAQQCVKSELLIGAKAPRKSKLIEREGDVIAIVSEEN